MNSYQDNLVKRTLFDVAQQTENAILEQLNDFISRGLLVVETQGPTLIQEATPTGSVLKVRNTTKLKLKDQEYIQKLETENKELREIIERLKAVL